VRSIRKTTTILPDRNGRKIQGKHRRKDEVSRILAVGGEERIPEKVSINSTKESGKRID